MNQPLVLTHSGPRLNEVKGRFTFTNSAARTESDKLFAAIIVRLLLASAAIAFFAAVERGFFQ